MTFGVLWLFLAVTCTVNPVVSGHSKKKTNNGDQCQLSLNADQKYCIMLEESVSAILSTFILHLPLKPLFCLFLSGRLRQVLLLWDSEIVLCFAVGYFMSILVL